MVRRELLIAILLTSLGCQPSRPEYPAARIAGNVSLAGQPIAEGRITFMPSANTAGVPVTAEISAGSYVAQNVPLGDVTVTFSAAKETGNMIREANREPYPEIVSIIPPQYSQGVPLHVADDNDAQNFALTTNSP